MQYLDASRPHSASGRAQWRDSLIVISSPDFRPSRSGFWFVHIINGAMGNNAEIELPSEAIGQFLARWAEDPEDALLYYFGFEAPKGLGPSTRYESGPKAPQGEVLASAKSSSELDF